MRQTSTKARARYKPRQEKMFILLRDQVPETGQTRIVQLIGASAMIGRNILMYFPWNRPDEEGAPLGNLNNRFGALFELRDTFFDEAPFTCGAALRIRGRR